MSGIDLAVELAASRFYDWGWDASVVDRDRYQADADVAGAELVSAVAPLIEAAIREQVAQEIEDSAAESALISGWQCQDDFDGAACHLCFDNAGHVAAHAARIARGATS